MDTMLPFQKLRQQDQQQQDQQLQKQLQQLLQQQLQQQSQQQQQLQELLQQQSQQQQQLQQLQQQQLLQQPQQPQQHPQQQQPQQQPQQQAKQKQNCKRGDDCCDNSASMIKRIKTTASSSYNIHDAHKLYSKCETTLCDYDKIEIWKYFCTIFDIEVLLYFFPNYDTIIPLLEKKLYTYIEETMHKTIIVEVGKYLYKPFLQVHSKDNKMALCSSSLMETIYKHCNSTNFITYATHWGLVDPVFNINVASTEGNTVFDRFILACHTLAERDYTIQLVFHGTSSINISTILLNGLNPTLRCGQSLGPGEYFGENPQISLEYCKAGLSMLVFIVIILNGDERNGKTIVIEESQYQLPIGTLSFTSLQRCMSVSSLNLQLMTAVGRQTP